MKQLGSLCKAILLDIVLLYKSLLHWIVSKVLIQVSAILMSIVFSVVFFIAGAIFLYFGGIELMNIVSEIQSKLNIMGGDFLAFDFFSIIGILFFIIGFAIMFIGMSFTRVLMAKLHIAYIEGKKLGFKNNQYFSKFYFLEYFKINIFLLAILFLIALIFIGIIGILFGLNYYFSGSEFIDQLSAGATFFGLFFFLISIIFSLGIIYIAYRFSFAHIILIDRGLTWKESLKLSYEKTQKINILGSLIIVLIMVIILLLPFSLTSSYIDSESENINLYGMYTQRIGNNSPESVLDKNNFEKYSLLNAKYGNLSLNELAGKFQKIRIIEMIYYIFDFLFIYGVIEMALASFYIKKIKADIEADMIIKADEVKENKTKNKTEVDEKMEIISKKELEKLRSSQTKTNREL